MPLEGPCKTATGAVGHPVSHRRVLRPAARRSIRTIVDSPGRLRQWHSLCRDPLLIGATAWTLVAAILFIALSGPSAGDTLWQVRIFWVFQLPLDALLAYSSWRGFWGAPRAAPRGWGRLRGGGGALPVSGAATDPPRPLAPP